MKSHGWYMRSGGSYEDLDMSLYSIEKLVATYIPCALPHFPFEWFWTLHYDMCDFWDETIKSLCAGLLHPSLCHEILRDLILQMA